MRKLFVGVVLAFIALSGCSESTSATEDLNIQGFAKVIEDPTIVIIDVRTPQEFAQGHIVNSLNIDVANANFSSEVSQLDKTKTYAVYCRSGNRSAVATAKMEKLGFTSLYNMTGGAIDWLQAGLPLVTP